MCAGRRRRRGAHAHGRGARTGERERDRPMRRGVVIVIALTALIVAVIGFWYLRVGEAQRAPGVGQQGEALIGGPFSLVNQDGERVTEADFAGRYMLVYFGYTYCPDFCPM